jgi:hypothetical protein
MLSSRFTFSAVSLSVLATFGCGASSRTSDRGTPPSLAANQLAVSGGRLQAWFLEAGESRIFDSFHDRQLDTDCIFQWTNGDGYVCLPSAPADVVYLDAACREPALRFDSTGVDALPAWVSGSVSAPGSARVGYHVADLVFTGGFHADAARPAVFAKGEDGCEPTRLELGLLPASLYRLELRDEDVFVAASATPLRVSDELSLKRLTAEDGAELTLGVLAFGDQACEPQVDGVCVPSPFSVRRTEPGPGLFLDAGCLEPAFDPSAEGLASAPRFGVDRSSGATRVFELERTTGFAKLEAFDVSTGEVVRSADGNISYTCEADARFAAWAPAAERTANLPVAAPSTVSFGSLRWVQQRSPVASSETPIAFEPGGAFLDEQGLGCRASASPKHQLACVVDGPEVFEVGSFKDATCSQRLYAVVGASDDAATLASVPRLRDVEGFGSDERILRSFKPYAGPTYRSVSGQCELDQPTNSLLQTDRATPLPNFERVAR